MARERAEWREARFVSHMVPVRVGEEVRRVTAERGERALLTVLSK